MAMTYEQSASLQNDVIFRGRVRYAVVRFADAIFLEAPAAEGHAARWRWAQAANMNPDMTAMQLQQLVVSDPAIQDAGVDASGKALVTDAALQAAVEVTAKKFI